MLQTIELHYNGRRPKLLENNVLVLYSPQKLKFEPGQKKLVDMKLKIKLPSTITGSCRLLFGLANHGLYLANNNYLTNESNKMNLHFEILNSNLTQRLQINNRHEIGYFTPDHMGTDIKYKFVKEHA